MSLALGFSAFAQQRVAKNELQSFKVNAKKSAAVGKEIVNETAAQFAPQTAKSVVINRFDNAEDGETMYTYYDLQSNSWVSNRMYQLPDGSVGVVATMSHQSNQSATDRGTGYNFYNGEEWQEQPEARVEDRRTGWPSIAQWGERGEILISHSPLGCYTREVAGEGEWQYRGELPPFPEGFEYDDDWAWPRIATSGDNHNIIHVIGDIQHSVSSDEVHHWQVYLRSEDAENWTITYSPLAQDGEEYDHYTADAYNITANGHNVAMIYGDDLQSHVVMYKSTDDGLTWTRRVVWENPYYGYDWENDPQSVFSDTLFGPASLAIALDNNGVAHVALSAYEYIHDELGNTYTTYRGRAVDGICYWNDTQEGPIADTDHPEYIGTPYEEHLAHANPHHAMRLWWPIPDEPGYVRMHADSTKWIGYVPMYEGYSYDGDMFYIENDYFYKLRSAQSGFPALSIDPYGNIACAFSAPNVSRVESNLNKYYRSIYVSYYNVDNGYWDQTIDDITDPDATMYLPFLISENIYTNSADNVVNPGEFWFSFESDTQPGLYWGSYATQSDGTENYIHVMKLIPEGEYVSVPENYDAVNPMTSTRIYPNPVVDQMNIEVNASQASAMNISIFNLMGQKVMEKNVSVNAGLNYTTISTNDLSSGVYFVTVSANGFNHTMKFVVK